MSEEEDKECSMCVDIIQPPCAITNCGHRFCAPCIKSWMKQSDHCPNCRTCVEKLCTNTALDEELRKLLRPCPHRRCTEQLRPADLEDHIKSCEWRQEYAQEQGAERLKDAIEEMKQRKAGDVMLMRPVQVFRELGEHQLLFECVSKATSKDGTDSDIRNCFLLFLMHDRIAQGQYKMVCTMYENFHMSTRVDARAACALACAYQGQYKEAKQLVKSVPIPDRTADLLTVFGFVYKKQNNYPRALFMLQQALEKPKGEFLHLLLRRTLGDICRKQERSSEAQEHYQYVWMNMPDNVLEEAELCCCMGKVAEQRGLYKDAIGHYKTALEKLPSNQPLEGVYKVSLADAERGQSYFAAARRDYEAGIQLIKQRLGEEHIELIDGYLGLGLLYKKYQEYEAAILWIHKAHKLADSKLQPKHYKRALVDKAMGDIHRKLRQFPEALACFERAKSATMDLFSMQEADILHDMGRVHYELQDYEEAKKNVGLACVHAEVHTNAEKQGMYYSTLALIEGMSGDMEKATTLFDTAKRLLEESLGALHPEVADLCMSRVEVIMSRLQLQIDNKEELDSELLTQAITYCNEAVAILLKVYGEEHPKLATLQTYLCICNRMNVQ